MKKIRYTLFLKGLIFLFIGFYLASLGIPSNDPGFTIHIGNVVAEDIENSGEINTTEGRLQKIYRIAGPIMILIGFLEIIMGILTFWSYKK